MAQELATSVEHAGCALSRPYRSIVSASQTPSDWPSPSRDRSNGPATNLDAQTSLAWKTWEATRI